MCIPASGRCPGALLGLSVVRVPRLQVHLGDELDLSGTEGRAYLLGELLALGLG